MTAYASYQEALEFVIAQTWADGQMHRQDIDDKTSCYVNGGLKLTHGRPISAP